MENKRSRVGKKEKGLSAWQLTMMALGTVIGGSFFLGSAIAIEAAGPSILIAFVLGGVLVYFILFALSEMTVSNQLLARFKLMRLKLMDRELVSLLVGFIGVAWFLECLVKLQRYQY